MHQMQPPRGDLTATENKNSLCINIGFRTPPRGDHTPRYGGGFFPQKQVPSGTLHISTRTSTELRDPKLQTSPEVETLRWPVHKAPMHSLCSVHNPRGDDVRGLEETQRSRCPIRPSESARALSSGIPNSRTPRKPRRSGGRRVITRPCTPYAPSSAQEAKTREVVSRRPIGADVRSAHHAPQKH